MLFSNQQSMASSALLFFGVFCIVGTNHRHQHGFFAAAQPLDGGFLESTRDFNLGCDTGPEALTNAFGVDIPQTCIDVPVRLSDDGSVLTAMKRCYYTYVPERCKSDDTNDPKQLPLVVDVHGLGSCPLYSAGYTGWKQRAEDECFVVMWPGGTSDGQFLVPCFNIPGFLRSEDRGTEGGNNVITAPCCCYEASFGLPTADPDDPLFLKTAIDSVIESFEPTTTNDASESTSLISIDRNRVYMAGHSNGCMASLSMAALYSDTIAAVCCHSGALLTPFPEDYGPVPIWLAHGMKDNTLPFEGSTLIDIPLFGGPLGFWSMGDTMDYLSKQNDCSEEEEIDIIGDKENENVGTVFRRTNCRDNATVELVALFEADHFPFQDSFGGLLTGTSIDTTALAWEFCSSHVRSPASEENGGAAPLPDNDQNEAEHSETTPAIKDGNESENSDPRDGGTDQNEAELVSAAPVPQSRNGPGMVFVTMVCGFVVLAPFLASPM